MSNRSPPPPPASLNVFSESKATSPQAIRLGGIGAGVSVFGVIVTALILVRLKRLRDRRLASKSKHVGSHHDEIRIVTTECEFDHTKTYPVSPVPPSLGLSSPEPLETPSIAIDVSAPRELGPGANPMPSGPSVNVKRLPPFKSVQFATGVAPTKATEEEITDLQENSINLRSNVSEWSRSIRSGMLQGGASSSRNPTEIGTVGETTPTQPVSGTSSGRRLPFPMIIHD